MQLKAAWGEEWWKDAELLMLRHHLAVAQGQQLRMKIVTGSSKFQPRCPRCNSGTLQASGWFIPEGDGQDLGQRRRDGLAIGFQLGQQFGEAYALGLLRAADDLRQGDRNCCPAARLHLACEDLHAAFEVI